MSPLEIVPTTYLEPLDLAHWFGRNAPLEVDLGCGDGAFLVEMARRHPERNFLGIERLLGRLRRVCRRASRLGLKNLRVLRIESSYATTYLIPRGAVSVLHIAFPDPWPKRKHHRRRLVQAPFLHAAAAALAPNGEIRLTTDHAEYFTQMQEALALTPELRAVDWPEEPDYPITDFEKIFRSQGLPIWRARAVRIVKL